MANIFQNEIWISHCFYVAIVVFYTAWATCTGTVALVWVYLARTGIGRVAFEDDVDNVVVLTDWMGWTAFAKIVALATWVAWATLTACAATS